MDTIHTDRCAGIRAILSSSYLGWSAVDNSSNQDHPDYDYIKRSEQNLELSEAERGYMEASHVDNAGDYGSFFDGLDDEDVENILNGR